jgi:ribosomal protein S18 acetylase RimI-like enzyme
MLLLRYSTNTMDYAIRKFRRSDEGQCERILRGLPEWFGIESSLAQYVKDTTTLPTWMVDGQNGEAIACLTLREHNPCSGEIHLIAVDRDYHRRGIGRMLEEFLEDHLRSRGFMFLQVKTLGPSRPDAHYEETRKFYEAMSFTALEEFSTLWPGNPCLLMVKRL